MSSLIKYIPAQDILERALKKATEEPVSDRMVKRGKFFLYNSDIDRYGSLRRPIFQYYGHNIVVAAQEYELNRDGYWCYATHKDFDLIPDTTDPLKWPEYERTDTGWRRIPDHKMLEATKPSIDLLKFDWSKALGATK
jgi:hypothetical protein